MNPNQNKLETGPIDAVITWVDGSDPAHIAKREAALRRDRGWSLTAIPAGRAPTRFADNGELLYCIAGIRKFLPWIRTIHLVTDEQRPEFLDEETCRHLKVNIVDHTEIFRGYEWALPTFNSRSIETMVFRIPRMAPRFLYFNDDFLIMKPTGPEAFFQDDHVVVRGEWQPIPKFGAGRMLISGLANHLIERVLGKPRPMHILPQIRSARMAGMVTQFLKNHHVPFAVRRKTLETHFHYHPEHLEHNIRYRFRDMRQFNTMPLAVHLEIASGNHTEDPYDEHVTIGFRGKGGELAAEKLAVLADHRPRFLCLQSLDQAPQYQREQAIRVIEQIIGQSKL